MRTHIHSGERKQNVCFLYFHNPRFLRDPADRLLNDLSPKFWKLSIPLPILMRIYRRPSEDLMSITPLVLLCITPQDFPSITSGFVIHQSSGFSIHHCLCFVSITPEFLLSITPQVFPSVDHSSGFATHDSSGFSIHLFLGFVTITPQVSLSVTPQDFLFIITQDFLY